MTATPDTVPLDATAASRGRDAPCPKHGEPPGPPIPAAPWWQVRNCGPGLTAIAAGGEVKGHASLPERVNLIRDLIASVVDDLAVQLADENRFGR
jgi:ABC-type sugar transport system substrate-binding protein